MYHAHFHIKESPFALTPDPRYLFMSQQHQEAMAHLLYGMTESGGFVQLTGEVGTGKTTLCRALVEQVPEDVDIALILNPKQTAVELVSTICDELRVDYPRETESLKILVDRLNRFLLENHSKGRRTTLVIDEAQNLSPQTLEQIRLLTNLETTTRKLLQIILIGQPELQEILARPEMRQLAQRITARYHLSPLSSEKTISYIKHRLEVAGMKAPVFTPGALRIMHRLSGGVPRLINIICDRALLGAYGKQQDRVSKDLLLRAYAEVKGPVQRSKSRRTLLWATAVLLVVFLGVGSFYIPRYLESQTSSRSLPEQAVQSLSVLPQPPELKSGSGQPQGESTETPVIDRDGIPERDVPVAALGDEAGTGGITEESVSTTLVEVFREGRFRTDRESAFKTLLRSWNAGHVFREGESACEGAEAAGFRCLSARGSWGMLKQYNRPAILELIDETGESRYVTIIGMTEREVTLDFFDRELNISRTDIDCFWFGSFTLLWKPPSQSRRFLKKGAFGPDVLWLRRQLDRVQGPPGGSDSKADPSFFDEALTMRVMAFQKAKGLKSDGVVGEHTLIQLNTTLQEPGIPLLGPLNP